MSSKEELRLPALEIHQGPNRTLYSFAIDGKLLPSIAAVSRLRRDEDAELWGYQRPEVLSHIAEIKAYLESKDPLLPNNVVIAFDDSVKYIPSTVNGPESVPGNCGTLVIPLNGASSEDQKPGWVVDGQQRIAAIRDAKIERFPIFATAFIASSDHEQREQFILVNSTKPLPKGLIYELLPATESRLPSALMRRRFPANLLQMLNHDPGGPLEGIIQTPTNPDGVIRDNSILKMLENSLTDGVLYRYRDPSTGAGDIGQMLQALRTFWGSVADVFPDAWGISPRRSRLTHGAGIISMGLIMDAICDRYGQSTIPSHAQFVSDLSLLQPVCAWTEGQWEFRPGVLREWNEIQNTPRHVQALANFLLDHYSLCCREMAIADR